MPRTRIRILIATKGVFHGVVSGAVQFGGTELGKRRQAEMHARRGWLGIKLRSGIRMG